MFGLTTSGATDTAYIDVRVGDKQTIHQLKLDAVALAASRDAQGNLPPGLPVNAAGTPVTAGAVAGYIGPESVKLGDAGFTFGNVIFSGGLNAGAIASNLGRGLTAAEIAGKPAAVTMFPLA